MPFSFQRTFLTITLLNSHDSLLRWWLEDFIIPFLDIWKQRNKCVWSRSPSSEEARQSRIWPFGLDQGFYCVPYLILLPDHWVKTQLLILHAQCSTRVQCDCSMGCEVGKMWFPRPKRKAGAGLRKAHTTVWSYGCGSQGQAREN